MKLPHAINCFFALMFFSAAASDLAQEPARSVTGSPEKAPENPSKMQTRKFGLVVHGGAGTIDRSKMTPERERKYRAGLERALTAGYEILKRGGSSLDATEAAVRVLEDDPHFNAGKGAVFTSAGTNELDAAIMDGKTLKAGAVAVIKRIKNPVSLARLVMEKSGHVMMDSEGAEAFAQENGVELLPDQKYFYTQERWDALQKIKTAEKRRTATEKRLLSPIKIGTEQSGPLRSIKMAISLRRLQPAARRTSAPVGSGIPRSSGRDVCKQCDLCGIRYWRRRIFYSSNGSARCFGSDGISWNVAQGGCANRPGKSGQAGRRGRINRDRPPGQHRFAI